MVATVASIDVTLRLLGADQFQAKMRDSGNISEQTGARVKRSLEGITASSERVSKAAEGLSRSSSAMSSLGFAALKADTSIGVLTKSFTLLGTAVGGLAGGVALNAFKNYADTATNISNRLATVIPIQSQRAEIDKQIFETAQRTRTSYEATANIYSRMSLSAGQLGASQTQILKVTETTQKALQAGGATVSESASIATQLSQALGSGRLAGDELRSIAENSPVLIQAIAKEFSTTVGGLKEMGSEGKLSADRVFKAILAAGTEVDELFDRTKPTIAGGIQQIDNALTRYIGNVDKSLGATNALVGGLQFVAKNLDTIGDSAALAVAALAGPLGARLLGGAGGRVAAPFRDAAATARAGMDTSQSSFEAARLARVEAEAAMKRARSGLDAFDNQPRFRQASGDVQSAYTRQAATVDKLREGSTKLVEKEAAALLKRGEAENVVAQISQAATNRVDAARRTLGTREEKLNDLLAKRPALEQAAAAAGSTPSRGSMKGYYDSLYKVVDARDKLAATNATIALTKRNIEALDEAIARERSSKTPSDFLPQAQARRAAEVARIPGLTSQRDAQGYDLNNREAALRAAEDKIGQAQLSARDAAGKKLIDLDNSISRQRASVAGQTEKLSAAEIAAAASRSASAETLARKQAQLDAAAIASTNQRRAAQQALQEAESRLGGLAGQVGASASTQRAAAVQALSTAEQVFTRSLYQEAEAHTRVEAATRATSATKVAFAGAAKAAGTAVSSLVGFLGGPLGAALTAASVGLIGYELYQARATARVEEHTQALGRLADRLKSIKAEQSNGTVRSDRDIIADRAETEQAAKAVRDRRDALLGTFNKASVRDSAASNLDGITTAPSVLDQAAGKLGVNLSKVVRDLRDLPSSSKEAADAAGTLSNILIEAAKIDPGYSKLAIQAADLGDKYREAAGKLREFEAARQAAIKNAIDNEFDLSLPDDDIETIDKAAQLGRETADAFNMGVNDRIQTGTELTDSLVKQAQDAKTAFEAALGNIDTETLKNALLAVGSSLDTVKANLDGTKISSGEAGAASAAFAQALALIQANQPDLSATVAQISNVTNAYRQMIGLQSVAVAGALTGDAKVAAEAKQREQSLKTLEDRLQRADKSKPAEITRIRRSLPGLNDAEYGRLYDAENPAKKGGGRKPAKSKEQKDGETLAKKLEELDQDTKVSALNDFDQKTVRFAQSAKVASDQIQAFITAARSGDMSSVPPVMQEIYDKMKLLEGVKLAKSALDDIFPGRKLARELEELRAAANASPEIAANIDLIEQRIRVKNAPEWATSFTSSFSDMAKSVVAGTATMADALATFKTKIINLALDVAFKPLENMLTSFMGGAGGAGGNPLGGLLSKLNLGDAFGLSVVPKFAAGVTSLGVISGPGTGTSDSILARVSNGESIINAKATKQHRGLIEALNDNRIPGFANGAVDIAGFGAGLRAQEARMAAGSSAYPQLSGAAAARAAEGAKSELHIHGGAARTEAQTSQGPMGPRTDVFLDKKVAAMLLGGQNTRSALKQIGSGRLTGR
jgi:tape measure domain-containing protein